MPPLTVAHPWKNSRNLTLSSRSRQKRHDGVVVPVLVEHAGPGERAAAFQHCGQAHGIGESHEFPQGTELVIERLVLLQYFVGTLGFVQFRSGLPGDGPFYADRDARRFEETLTDGVG